MHGEDDAKKAYRNTKHVKKYCAAKAARDHTRVCEKIQCASSKMRELRAASKGVKCRFGGMPKTW